MDTMDSASMAHPGGRHGMKIVRIAGLAVLGLGLAVLFAFVFGLLVQALWNWLMPAVFGLARITFWQAFGILLLAKILFGSHQGLQRGRGRHFKRHFHGPFAKHANACESGFGEEPLPGNGRKWRYFRTYWHDEGKAAFEAYLQRMAEREKSGEPRS